MTPQTAAATIKHIGGPPQARTEACDGVIKTDFRRKRGVILDASSQMTTITFLAMSTGAMVAIIIGAGLPLFLILFVLRNKKKNP